jgi:hypothetical protein
MNMRIIPTALVALGSITLLSSPLAWAQGRISSSNGISNQDFYFSSGVEIVEVTPRNDGGVDLHYSHEFDANEVLSINQQNQPEIMMRDASGNLTPHPNKIAVAKGAQILVIDKQVRMPDLEDNYSPTVTFNLGTTPTTDIANIPDTVPAPLAFSVPLAPVSEQTAVLGPGNERTVAMPTGQVPAGWRTVTIGTSEMLLDENGVVQATYP